MVSLVKVDTLRLRCKIGCKADVSSVRPLLKRFVCIQPYSEKHTISTLLIKPDTWLTCQRRRKCFSKFGFQSKEAFVEHQKLLLMQNL